MSGITATGWWMFIFAITMPVAAALAYYSQSRPKAKPNHWVGIRIRVVASSPEVWRAAHREAFRWERANLVCFCGAAMVCLLVLRSWHLVLAESVLFGGYLIPMGFNVRHACTVARRMVESQRHHEEDLGS
ncbi:MAG: SdpI family protein [Propionibacterium acidifaciens]